MKALRSFTKDLIRSRTNVSWLITFGCLGLVLGVGIAALFTNSWKINLLWLLICGLILFSLSIISRLRIMILAALVAGMMIGVWRGAIMRVELTTYQTYIEQEVRLIGIVVADPDTESSNLIKVRLDSVEAILQEDYDQIKSQVDPIDYFESLPGQVWISLMTPGQDIKRSDRIEVNGKLKSGFGSFAATMSYGKLTSVERSDESDPLRDLRDSFGDKLRSVIPSPAADLGMGILAGQKTALPLDLSQAFIIASLTHIVVASGYNLTILIRFARRLFAKVSRLVALVFGSGLAIAFAALVGFSPSMTRASLVASLSLLAWYYGRRFHPVTLLSLVAAITVIVSPFSIWGDLGWYLSFLSFVGVIILAPLIRAYFFGSQTTGKVKTSPSGSLWQVLIETLSAQIMAAPIVALFMGQFSVYGILANLLVLPILPLVMLMTFVAGLTAFVLPMALAQIIAWPAARMLDYVIGVANWVADLPVAQASINLSMAGCVIIYVVLLCVIIYLRSRTGYNLRSSNVVE